MLLRTVLALSIAASAAVPTHAQSLADLDSAASFVFIGRISKASAVTMDVIPVSERTVTVDVTQVLRTTTAVGKFAGKTITLLVREGGSTAVDEQATFFAAGWLAGESLALREIGRLPARGPTAMTPEAVRQGLQDPQV